MKITLELLKEKGASEEDIKCFTRLAEWDILDLIDRCLEAERCHNKCNKDEKYYNTGWLWRLIDTQEDFEIVINHLMTKSNYNYRVNSVTFNCVFEKCITFFENKPELFEEVIDFYISKQWYITYLFLDGIELCQKFFENNPELLYKIINHELVIWHGANYALKHHGKFFANNLVLFKKVINDYVAHNQSVGVALAHCQQAFAKLPKLYEEVKKYQSTKSF